MAEHEKTGQQKQEKVDQKHRTVKQKPQPLFDQFHAWEQGIASIGETPFLPRMDEHAELIARAASDEHRANLVLHLQQTYGNRYVQRLVESMKVQAKLNISAPNDVYEQEADSVAKAVTGAANSQVQRQPEEEEELQGKPVGSQPAIVPENLETRIKSGRGGGHPLTDTVREPMERVFGADFSNVRVHTDSEADALNQQLSAKAFTTGEDVFFRENEYSPGSDSGRELLAHELTHVVQQEGETTAVSDRQVVQSGRTPRTGGDKVLQRHVALAKEQEGTADFVEWTSINYAIGEAGEPSGLLKDLDLSGMGKDDTLFIVGHGSPGRIKAGTAPGNVAIYYTADEIVRMLFEGPKALKRPIKEIGFTSCYAGRGIKPTSILGKFVQWFSTSVDYTTSIVAKIKNKLDKKKWGGVKVTGARGPSIKSAELGKEFTVVPGKGKPLELVGTMQAVLEEKHDPKGEKTKAIAEADTWAQLNFGRDATRAEKAKFVSEATADFYRDFVESIKTPTEDCPAGKALKDKGLPNLSPKEQKLLGYLKNVQKPLTLPKPMLELESK